MERNYRCVITLGDRWEYISIWILVLRLVSKCVCFKWSIWQQNIWFKNIWSKEIQIWVKLDNTALELPPWSLALSLIQLVNRFVFPDDTFTEQSYITPKVKWLQEMKNLEILARLKAVFHPTMDIPLTLMCIFDGVF